MTVTATLRKVASLLLILVIAVWAEAGLAAVQGDQVMQCSMSMHQMQAMGKMSCCPLDEASSPSMSAQRPPCCSVSNQPEQPLNFVVTSKQVKFERLQVVTVAPATSATPAVASHEVWRSVNAPAFIKPVLELKTDLRI